MDIHDIRIRDVLISVNEILEKKPIATFKDVIATSKCKRYSVKEIGEILEWLRRNGMIKASSRFGCSELLEFSAKSVTEEGKKYL